MESAVPGLDVCAALVRARARLRRAQPLPAGVWVAHWGNADTETAYLRPGHHTLSFYLEGGHAVRCREAPSARGEPGTLCSLPAGHESRWDVHGSLQLLHVYLPTLADLAQAACLSEYHFARMFKTSFGVSPQAWVMQRRVERARTLLVQGRLSPQTVAQRCGYAHLSHMNAALRRSGLGSATALRSPAR
jgi:AraC family transcriptional regulator